MVPAPPGGQYSALAVLQEAEACTQVWAIGAASSPSPPSGAGGQAVLGGSGHLSREAVVNGNCLLENNHNLITGAYFSNRKVLTWKSLGEQGQCILSCKF